MRAASLCALFAFGCSPKEAPPPTEFVQFHYLLTPDGTEKDVLLPIPPGSLPCMRQAKEIRVEAKKGGAQVLIALRDAATMPSELQASTVTSGKVNMEIIVPDALDLGTATGFATSDPGDLFVCRLRVLGPDPFVEFRATFSCQSKMSGGRQLAVTDGEARARICP